MVERKRVFINAIRTIQPGDELAYDYQIQRDDDDAPNVDEIFACRCGAKSCRGNMLEPRKKPRARKKTSARKKRPQLAIKPPRARSRMPLRVHEKNPKKTRRRGA